MPSARSLVPVLCLLAALAVASPASRAATRPKVAISGTGALAIAHAREAAGRPPRSPRRFERWAKAATRRIVGYYKRRGYTYARAWWRIDEDGSVIRIHVDEGRIHDFQLVGGGLVDRIALRTELSLPHGVYHGRTVRRQLRALKKELGAQNVYHKVIDTPRLYSTGFGEPAPRRILRVFLVEPEPIGWSADVRTTARWGVTATGGFAAGGVGVRGDRVAVDVEVSIPYRQYVAEEGPQLRWVHGALDVGYRAPIARRSPWSLGTSHRADTSRDRRADIGYSEVLAARYLGTFDVHWRPKKLPLTMELGVGGSYTEHVESVSKAGLAVPALAADGRFELRLRTEVDIRPTVLSQDEQNRIELLAGLSIDEQGDPIGHFHLHGRTTANFGDHQLRAQLGALLVVGDAAFWDEQTLGGPVQRVYFRNMYWVRTAAQLGLAWRVRVGRFQLGLFHDLSVFGDRTRPDTPINVVNAFGPSFHTVVLRMLAVDIYYGFGFELAGTRPPLETFSHNFSFNVSTVF